MHSSKGQVDYPLAFWDKITMPYRKIPLRYYNVFSWTDFTHIVRFHEFSSPFVRCSYYFKRENIKLHLRFASI